MAAAKIAYYGQEMFDFRDYSEHRTIGEFDITTEAEEIDDDLSADIDNLLNNRFGKLYRTDRYKRSPYSVDIVHPVLPCPGAGSLLKGPNNIRFLLSLYPGASDLENIDKIVLRPRYVEINETEIMALYLRKKKILVQYLHHPFFYDSAGSRFRDYSEFKPVNLSQIAGTGLIQKSPRGEAVREPRQYKVPPAVVCPVHNFALA